MHYLLKNLEIPAYIGVYEFEKGQTQTLILNVGFEFDATQASLSDDLADTIDYAQIETLLKKICVAAHYELLEKLHAVIIAQVTEVFPQIKNLSVAIEKRPFETGSVVVK